MMGIVSSKDVILGKVRNALLKKEQKMVHKPDFTQSLYPENEEDLAVLFAENLVATKAEFYFSQSVEEFQVELNKLIGQRGLKNMAAFEKGLIAILPKQKKEYISSYKDISKAEVGINFCEALVARLGSVIVSSKQTSGRSLSIYPPINIVIAFTSQLVFDIKDGLKKVQEKYPRTSFPTMICLTTGPSRTADIEKTLVLGAHGPKELIVFLIDDSDSTGL